MIFRKRAIFLALCLVALTFQPNNASILKDLKKSVSLKSTPTENGIKIQLIKNGQTKLSGTIATGTNFKSSTCKSLTNCKIDSKSMSVVPIDHGFEITHETEDLATTFQDCFNLSTGQVNWYGGPERHTAKWPIEKLELSPDRSYTLTQFDNFAVAEPYWLNSKGSYIYVDQKVPLFVSQNVDGDDSVCFIAKAVAPYIMRKRVLLKFTLIVMDDPREAHLHAVEHFLKKPTGRPHDLMIKEPIWTSWAKYKKPISDEIILEFAQDIVDHGFKGGQLEIDDDWEICYGDQQFKSDKFANISQTVKALKDLEFRVTLWVHPFVDEGCTRNAEEGNKKGFFVKNVDGENNATWWDSGDSHQIDFTNPEARKWYSDRLKLLQANPGIDSFKFDAGESDYATGTSVFNSTEIELYPRILSESYVRTCAEFGDLIEVRSASSTQDLPIFVRMLDKDSNWGDNNGLYTLITTLLQMNMNGYTMVLPDMVGGNGYNGAPSAELLARWTQANTFMPAMQFSYLPWEITSDDFDGLSIIKKYVSLHAEYADEIYKAMNASIVNGSPVNPPIWWIAPDDPIALKTDDEYLLGENILVAPVIMEGAQSRDVYLTEGLWKDGNSGGTYVGPVTLTNYSAPIDVLPWFIKLQ